MATQTNVPRVQPLIVHGDPNKVAQNWGKWRKSCQYFLDASGIASDTHKKAILLHMPGPEIQKVFDTLTPADDTCDKALEVLNTHFAVKATFHLTISMRGQRATSKIQRK